MWSFLKLGRCNILPSFFEEIPDFFFSTTNPFFFFKEKKVPLGKSFQTFRNWLGWFDADQERVLDQMQQSMKLHKVLGPSGCETSVLLVAKKKA